MKTISKISLATLLTVALSTSLSATECIHFDKAQVNWTSYKTLAKVGVSGTFNKVELETNKKAMDMKNALLNTAVKIDIKNIDAKADEKTNNILKYFVSNLDNTAINAKIKEVYEDTLNVEIILNNITKVIPMNYKVENGKVVSNGVIDGLDFDLAPALKILNTQVAGHLNKGWYDIPVNFSLEYKNSCM